MQIAATSRPYILIGIDGPASAGDLTQYPVAVALMPDNGTEPGVADWRNAEWIDGKAALLVGPGGTVAYPAGLYFAWAQISAGAEVLVLPSGRVRIGDVRA